VGDSESSVLVEDTEEEEDEEEMFFWCFVAIFRPSREVVTALLSMLEGVKSGCSGFGLHCVGVKVIVCQQVKSVKERYPVQVKSLKLIAEVLSLHGHY
jgi:hypothetical protein